VMTGGRRGRRAARGSKRLRRAWRAPVGLSPSVRERALPPIRRLLAGLDDETHERHRDDVRRGCGRENLLKRAPRATSRSVTEVVAHTPDHPGLFQSLRAQSRSLADPSSMRRHSEADGFALESIHPGRRTAARSTDGVRVRTPCAIDRADAGRRDLAAPPARATNRASGEKSAFKVPSVCIFEQRGRPRSPRCRARGLDRPGLLYDVTLQSSKAGFRSRPPWSPHMATDIGVFYVATASATK